MPSGVAFTTTSKSAVATASSPARRRARARPAARGRRLGPPGGHRDRGAGAPEREHRGPGRAARAEQRAPTGRPRRGRRRSGCAPALRRRSSRPSRDPSSRSTTVFTTSSAVGVRGQLVAGPGRVGLVRHRHAQAGDPEHRASPGPRRSRGRPAPRARRRPSRGPSPRTPRCGSRASASAAPDPRSPPPAVARSPPARSTFVRPLARSAGSGRSDSRCAHPRRPLRRASATLASCSANVVANLCFPFSSIST